MRARRPVALLRLPELLSPPAEPFRGSQRGPFATLLPAAAPAPRSLLRALRRPVSAAPRGAQLLPAPAAPPGTASAPRESSTRVGRVAAARRPGARGVGAGGERARCRSAGNAVAAAGARAQAAQALSIWQSRVRGARRGCMAGRRRGSLAPFQRWQPPRSAGLGARDISGQLPGVACLAGKGVATMSLPPERVSRYRRRLPREVAGAEDAATGEAEKLFLPPPGADPESCVAVPAAPS